MTLPRTPMAGASAQGGGSERIEPEPEKSAKKGVTDVVLLGRIQAVARGLKDGYLLFNTNQLDMIVEACAKRDDARTGKVVEEFSDWLGLRIAMWYIGDTGMDVSSLTNLLAGLLRDMDHPDGVFRDFLVMSGNESP